MARKLRLEYPGAIYHVINRGNYRAWVFRDDRTKAAFQACLFDACARCGWTLHAFVVMGNHFHLAVETPLGNLVAGMQWLQSTFANRFNKLRGERGHLFQGRYKALLIEPGDALAQVCHYIHLNPVRADVVTADRLPTYRFSSLWFLPHPTERPKPLDLRAALDGAGQLPDSPKGWRAYQRYLEWQAIEGPVGKNKAYVCLSRGWAIGTPDFKAALLHDQASAIEAKAWEHEGRREVQQGRWKKALEQALAQLSNAERADRRKAAPWKVATAAHLKQSTDVSNAWLAQHLDMGSHFYVSKHLGLLSRRPDHPAAAFSRRLKVKGKA